MCLKCCEDKCSTESLKKYLVLSPCSTIKIRLFYDFYDVQIIKKTIMELCILNKIKAHQQKINLIKLQGFFKINLNNN